MDQHRDALFELACELNPWWRDGASRTAGLLPYRRHLFPTLWNELLDPLLQRALVVVGPRQVGKSTLLQQVADHLLDEEVAKPADLLCFDFSEDRCPPGASVRGLLEAVRGAAGEGQPRFLLLDEITRAPGWDRALKTLVDGARREPPATATRVLVTDSSASILRTGQAENLQGRVVEHALSGLSFREFLEINCVGDEQAAEDVLQRVPEAAELYLSLGGLPEHARVGLQDPSRLRAVRARIAQDVVSLAISRDLAEQTRDVERVRGLFVALVTSAGSEFQASKLARSLDAAIQGSGTDARTVQKWVRLLEAACLVRVLPRRVAPTAQRASGVARLGGHPRIYPEEHALIPALSPFADPMSRPEVRSMVLETAVLQQLVLRPSYPPTALSYLRTRDGSREIDFVLDGPESSLGIEVTTGSRIASKASALQRAGERAGIDRLLLVHGGTATRTQGSLTLVPFSRFLLDPAPYLEPST